MDRRTFMQLLGIGGLSTGNTPSISLFGSSDAPDELYIPDRALVGMHFVVQPRPRFEPVRRMPAGNDGVVVGRINSRAPNMKACFGGAIGMMDMRQERLAESVSIDLDRATVEMTHTAYYLSAHRLRQRFTDFTRKVAHPYGNYTTIVTVIDNPITFRRGDGHNVFAQMAFQMYVLNATTHSSPDALARIVGHFDVCSESGQYPIDAPSDIEVGRLLQLDREVIASGGLMDSIMQRLRKA